MNSPKIVIVVGSARTDGNTHQLSQQLAALLSADLIDLTAYQIHPYTYDHRHTDDDFLPLIRKIIADYDKIIFATPVYWYSMSAQLKIFFDRITDLLQIDKPTGRLLRGKSMGMLSCGNDDSRVPGFAEPFAYSAAYLGMHYLGDVHLWIENKGNIPDAVNQRLAAFAAQWREQKKEEQLQ